MVAQVTTFRARVFFLFLKRLRHSTQKRQLPALYLLEMPISTERLGFENVQLMGEGATDPIEPSSGVLAALLLLAGRSPLRRRNLPAHPTAHTYRSNCRFLVHL